MQLFASPTNTVFQTRQTEKISNKANQTARWFSPSLDSVSFSASSASPTSIHFGNTSPSTDDTAAIELMEALLPRLSEATNWQVKVHLDCYGSSRVGTDLSFTLGDTRYTLRDIYDYPNIPLGMKKGTVLISEDASGKQEYPIGKESVFYKYKSQFMQVGSPILTKPLIDRIVSQTDQLSTPSYYGYWGTQNAIGTLSFSINGEDHHLSIDHAKGSYLLTENSVFSSQEVESFWHAIKERYTLQNDEENLREFPSLEQFKADFPKRSTSRIEHKLTPESFQQLYESIKSPIEEAFLRDYNIGPAFNPRPLIRTIANRLLNDFQNTRLKYYDHHQVDEMTYHPNQTQPGNDSTNDLNFEISKYKLPNSNIERYKIRSSGGKKGYINIEVSKDQDSELLDDVMAIAKVKSKLDLYTWMEPFFQNHDIWQRLSLEKQELLQNQTQLLANLAAKLAALTD
jgi:hypothetical protein